MVFAVATAPAADPHGRGAWEREVAPRELRRTAVPQATLAARERHSRVASRDTSSPRARLPHA